MTQRTIERALSAWHVLPVVHTGGNQTKRPRPRACCGTRYLHRTGCYLKKGS